MMSRSSLFALAAAVGLALVTPSAVAKPTEEAQRLMKLRDAERYEVQTPHSSIKAGAARVHVAAPTDAVRKIVTDYKNYPDFISKFEKAHVVGKEGDKTDVYLQVPILKGAAKIWAVVRFDPPKNVNGEEQVSGSMVKGNVKRLDATWRIRKIDDQNTQLNLELLIVPKLPVPGSLVTGEVAYAADEAVMGSRNRAEKEQRDKKK
jgi:ribosome-associated toxin RatA of RatAB toxin-antitoxin module